MSQSNIQYPQDENTPTSHLPFSPCAVVGNLVFVSGQASVDASGKIIGDSFEGEFRRSIENLRAVLKTAGCDLQNIVQTRNYVRDDADLAEYNKLYAEYFQNPLPTRTTITNCLPSTIRYEVECIAVLPEAD
ncbi:RidA family protein [Thalassoglobus polymorphus]|uniref:Enamine/imine deaminase n=1 Tax=Thalassoglobus polymorphus TaxID=2527994 RepID=A0A517QTA5_9PLAN|nr:RidA family protein [Thalassoglobus polymorphus]QDT34869.1 Enamine/imine deaminase [Thalassoglobus polymorphus]